MNFKIPGDPHFIAATPSSADVIHLVGSRVSFENVIFTDGQAKDLFKFYGLDVRQIEEDVDDHIVKGRALFEERKLEWEQAKPSWGGMRVNADGVQIMEPPSELIPPNREGSIELMLQGSQRNILRAVRRDGLRIMAAISPFLQDGEDPVKFILVALSDMGLDVCGGDWLFGEDSAEE